MKEKYIPGEGCECSARCSCECGCDVDWTPREVYELREQVKHLQSKIEGMGYRHSHLRCQIIQAENATWLVKSRLQSEREQRDRLAEALRELCETLLADKPRDITDLLNKAGDALAAVKGGSDDN
jgi:chromosome segregation ATPase